MKLIPHKCETCGVETESAYRLMSTAGKDRVMVRFFCDEKCYEPFVTRQNEEGGCSWCGLAVGSSAARGPMNELYCDNACYESAGKALFDFQMRENPGAGRIIGVKKATPQDQTDPNAESVRAQRLLAATAAAQAATHKVPRGSGTVDVNYLADPPQTTVDIQAMLQPGAATPREIDESVGPEPRNILIPVLFGGLAVAAIAALVILVL